MSNLNGFLKSDIGPFLQIRRTQYVMEHIVLPSVVYSNIENLVLRARSEINGSARINQPE